MFKRHLVIFLLVISLLFSTTSVINAEEIVDFDPNQVVFETIDRDDGLSNLSVSAIAQDKFGFIWFGTQGGLNRYDGNEFKVYSAQPFSDDNLLHNLIQTMYYDNENHDLWIGTYQGVSHFDINESKFVNYTVEENGLSNSIIVTIEMDNQGFVWFGTMEGLNRLNPNTGEIDIYDIPGDVVRDLHMDSQGRLLIGSYEGLLYYDNETDSIIDLELDLPSDFVMVVNEFDVGTLTLGFWGGGVLEIDSNSFEVLNHNLPLENVYSLSKSNDGLLWIGTWGNGLFVKNGPLDVSHFVSESSDDTLAHPIVYSMIEDDTGIMWFGTNGGGVSKLNLEKKDYVIFKSDSIENALNPGKINAIFRDSNDDLWIAIYNNGLNRYDSSEDLMYSYFNDDLDSSSLFDDHIISIIQYDDNNLLLGSSTGLGLYNQLTDEFSRLDILTEDHLIYALKKQEDILWIGTYRNGVYKYNIVTEELISYSTIEDDNQISGNLINDIYIDSINRVWIGTNSGLNLIEPNSNDITIFSNNIDDSTGLGSDTVRDILEDSKGNIWIATNGGGLSIYNEDMTFSSFTEKEGMPSNVVLNILEDEIGNIWVSTQSGLAQINIDTKAINVLTPKDGIGGWDFNAGHLKDNDGSLLFGGIHGITRISDDYKYSSNSISKIFITDLELNQNSINDSLQFFNNTDHKFEANENNIGFKFVSISYDSTTTETLFYRLKGFEKDYIQVRDNNFVNYSNLPSGEYIFEVYSVNNDGETSELSTVSFSIDQPFYRSTLAYIFYIVLILIAIYLVYKLRESTIISKKNSDLEKLNSELENLSIRDSLTGAFNRRYFDVEIENIISLSVRSNLNISLMILDVDNFKQVNDLYGHLKGDIVLKEIANRIDKTLLRTTDFVARFGGDEFAVLLFDTTSSGALLVAEKIRKVISTVQFSDNIQSTVSIGLFTTTADKTTTSESLLLKADKALYKAKEDGKDKIHLIN